METQEPDAAAEARKKQKKAAKKDLTLERVFMAAERLQMAWIRVTTTLTALGFTIYKIFESLMQEGKHLIFGTIGGREIGMVMLFGAIVGLILATQQHHKRLAKLKNFYGKTPFPTSLVVSYMMMALSLFLFLSATFRLAS